MKSLDDQHAETGAVAARHPWLRALRHRWPTWLAIVMAAVLAPGTGVAELANALPLLALGYLAAAVFQRRSATWPLVMGVVLAFATLRLQSWIDPTIALAGVAVLLVLWGAIKGQLRQGSLLLEAAGMVGFTAIALTATSVEPSVGRYVVAVGWFGHAAWDFAHLQRNKVVARSFAEWCAVFDVLRAIGILVLPLPQ